MIFIGSFTFKKSSWKADSSYEFFPTNLHLQRMWAHNSTLKRTNFYDIYTVGAFSAHSLKTKGQGLHKMLTEMPEKPLIGLPEPRHRKAMSCA